MMKIREPAAISVIQISTTFLFFIFTHPDVLSLYFHLEEPIYVERTVVSIISVIFCRAFIFFYSQKEVVCHQDTNTDFLDVSASSYYISVIIFVEICSRKDLFLKSGNRDI